MSEQIKQFLDILYGDYYKNGNTGIIEFRLIEDSGDRRIYPGRKDRKDKTFVNQEILYKCIERIKSIAISHKDYSPAGIFFGICPREGGEFKKANIKKVAVIWQDLDAKSFPGGSKEEALKMIRGYELAPTIIVDSGNGFHCYWKLSELCEDTILAETVMKKLSIRLNGDHTQDVTRILRFPGTFNYKNPKKPKEVTILEINPDNIYNIGQFNDLLKDIKSETRTSQAIKREIELENPEISEKPPKKFEELLKKDRRIYAIYSGEKQYSTNGGWSENDYHLAFRLYMRGYTDEEVGSVILNAPYNKGRQKKLRDSNLKTTLTTASNASQAKREENHEKKKYRDDIDCIRYDPEIKSSLQRKRKISEEIIEKLNNDGKFYKTDEGNIYFFNSKKRKLMGIYCPEFKSFVNEYFGINASTNEYNFLEKEIESEAIQRGNETEIFDFCYYDLRKNVLYIYDNEDMIFRIDKNGMKIVENGHDGVMFIKKSDRERITIGNGKKIDGLMDRLLFSKINFGKGSAVNPDEQKLLFEMYFYSLFFETAQHDKPIAAFIGEKGSGKSKAFEMIGTILFGKHFRLKPKPADINDIKDNATSSYIYVMDNLDGRVDHLLDIIASIATRMGITRRKLYTDNEVINIDPRAFLGITCRTPRFNRDDISDRMLFFRVERLNNFIGASSLMGCITNNREHLWAEILERLQFIIKLLECSMDQSPWETKFRVADFANLLLRMCDNERVKGEVIYSILEKMVGEQTKFTLEDNSIFLALEDYLERPVNSNGKEIDTTELYKELKHIADDNGLPFPQNTRSFGIQLKQIMGDLTKYWNGRWQIDEHRGSKNRKMLTIKRCSR